MAAIKHLLRCLGEAACAHGLKALAGVVPFGSALYDIAENARQRLREQRQDDQLHALAVRAAVEADRPPVPPPAPPPPPWRSGWSASWPAAAAGCSI